jgi:CheY-like chemotaxis protein
MKRILLIEPNTSLARLYQGMFTEEGYQVVHVASAQSGIDASDKAAPDIVILELQLPRHSGIEFLHEFRSYAEWWEVPVIINTVIPPSKIAPAEGALKTDLGVRAILYKPQATMLTLRQAVKEQLTAA